MYVFEVGYVFDGSMYLREGGRDKNKIESEENHSSDYGIELEQGEITCC